MNSKTCTLCQKSKSISEYHKDTKGTDGFAARCKTCKNASRRQVKVNMVKLSIPKTVAKRELKEAIKEPKKITQASTVIITRNSIFEELMEKFNAPFTLTVTKQGSRLQVHTKNPDQSWKGDNATQILEKALSFRL